MNMGIVTILIYSVFVGITLLIINNYLKTRNSIENKKVNCGVFSSIKIEEIDNIIDKIIQDSFNSYMFTNILYKDIKYISDDKQKEIIYSVCDNVTKTISNNLFELILLFYSEEEIYNIIASKVYFIVNNYCLQFNTPK